MAGGGWRMVARTLAIATLFGAFLAFVRVRTAYDPPARLVGLAHIVAISWIGTSLALAFHRWAQRWRWIGGDRWREALAAGVLMAAPMGLIVWVGDRVLAPAVTPWSAIPGYIVISAVISLFIWAILVLCQPKSEPLNSCCGCFGGVSFLSRVRK